ncbi:Hypothetical protein CINCED_3A016167 [Cinara cedri]|uniref:Uncharacterized protein n=1 Tax=Cinara cedri TaxID=506608 RepID=A0A5E4NAD0_9HEMI|nr:Hypothetical protein CINCED_3A016167 [Cinara cedri]
MLASITLYRKRVSEWLQEAVGGNYRDGATTVAATDAATATATATDHWMDREKTAAAVTAAAAVPVAAVIAAAASTSGAASTDDRQHQPRQQDTIAAMPGTSLSLQPLPPPQPPDEEFMAATVLSSMPEDMPLPPLAYTRRRSSSKTHTRLYRIRLPPKPRRAKR